MRFHSPSSSSYAHSKFPPSLNPESESRIFDAHSIKMSKQLGLDKALDTYDMINAARRKGKNGGLYYDFDLASAVNARPKSFSQKFSFQACMALVPF
jgi:hypothetical protein